MTEPGQFVVSFEGPIDFAASLEIFRRSGDDLIDRWDGEWLTRTVRLEDRSVAYACRPIESPDGATFEVIVEDASHAPAIEEAILKSFVAVSPQFRRLCRTDPVIGRLAKLHFGFRPILHPDLMVALVRCISAQQVNLKWAATVRGRLAEKYGRRHEVVGRTVYSLDPERLSRLETADIRALQFTTSKAEYIINAARAVAAHELHIADLDVLTDAEVIARVIGVRGLGVWSAEWVLARTLGRPRISAGDLGVRKAVGKAYLGGRMPTPDEVRSATLHWGAATALAQELLLHAQHLKTLEANPAVAAPETKPRRGPPRALPAT
jgi:DNA-3-methyladenine glycosylase II